MNIATVLQARSACNSPSRSQICKSYTVKIRVACTHQDLTHCSAMKQQFFCIREAGDPKSEGTALLLQAQLHLEAGKVPLRDWSPVRSAGFWALFRKPLFSRLPQQSPTSTRKGRECQGGLSTQHALTHDLTHAVQALPRIDSRMCACLLRASTYSARLPSCKVH